MKQFTAVLVAGMTVGLPLPTAHAQDTRSQSTAVTRTSGDPQKFVQDMANAGMAEVHLGNLASQRAFDPEVKAFADLMVKDHTKANKELEEIATKLSVQPPKEIDSKHREMAERLTTLQGDAFDRDYMNAMVNGHEEVVAKLRSLIGSGTAGTSGAGATGGAAATGSGSTGSTATAGGDDDRALAQWAAKTLPIVQQHLERAREIQQKLSKQ